MRLRTCICIFGLLASASLMAQEAGPLATRSGGFYEFEAGDMQLGLGAGVGLGLGFLDTAAVFYAPNLKPAASISMSFMAYTTPALSFGAEAEATFYKTAMGRDFFYAPVLGKAAWSFMLDPFTLSPFVGAGLAVSVLGEQMRHVDPLVSLGTVFNWRYNADISYGLKARVDLVPQFYLDAPSSNHSLLQLGIILGATYHL